MTPIPSPAHPALNVTRHPNRPLTALVNQRELVHCTDDLAVHSDDDTLAMEHSEDSRKVSASGWNRCVMWGSDNCSVKD